MLQIFLITLVPVALGMWIRQQFPDFARRLEKVTNRLAVAILVAIITAAIVREWNRLPTFFAQVGIGVVLLNVISVLMGFWFGKLFDLKKDPSMRIAKGMLDYFWKILICFSRKRSISKILKELQLSLPS
jgi:predicted Na+-dependent transporter